VTPAVTLLLVPGLNNTEAVWSPTIESLTAHGCRCVARTLPAVSSIEAIAEELATEIRGRLLPVGFSFGGYVALALAEMVPNRVAGFALLGSTPRADTAEERCGRLAAARTVADQPERYPALIGAGESTALHPNSLLDAALMGNRRDMVRAYGAQRFVAHQHAAADRHDRSAVLQQLRSRGLPLTFAAGAYDRVISLEQQRIAAAACDASLTLIPGAGHLAPLEQPAAVAEWLLRLNADVTRSQNPETAEVHP
jgi:pimeloyl-ACP methyl ester carboxylesterase